MCMFVCTAGVREGITLYVYVCVYCGCEEKGLLYMCMFVCTASVREGITLYVYVCVYCECERRDYFICVCLCVLRV